MAPSQPPIRFGKKVSLSPPRERPELPNEPPRWRGAAIAVVAIIAIGLLVRVSLSGKAPEAPASQPIASASASGAESASAKKAPPRCAPIPGGETFTIGEASAAARDADAGEDDDPLDAPFAALIGRGT